jgi:hypothetical protein
MSLTVDHMRTRAAVALSFAGVLITGSAALAVNTQTLSNSTTGTTGDANRVLLPEDSAAGTSAATLAPTPADVAGPGATPPASPSPGPGDNTGGPPSPAPADQGIMPVPVLPVLPDAGVPVPAPVPVVPVPVPVVPVVPGDDKGGLRNAPEPGDDSGGHGGRSGSGGGSDD